MGAAEVRPPAPRWVPWVLVAACILPRLPGLGLPLLEEGHAWRQASTAMIARNFHRHGYRLPWPEIDVTPEHRPDQRRRFTNSEFPLYQWLVALGYGLVGVREWVGRVLSIGCTAAAVWVLFAFVSRLAGGWAATVAAAFVALNPMAVFYTRAFLPEPLMLLLAVVAMDRAARWSETGSRREAWLAAAAATLAAMVKQPALHLIGPPAVAAVAAGGRSWWRKAETWLVLAAPLAGCLAWYSWSGWLGRRFVPHFAVGGGPGLINPSLWLGEQDFWWRFGAVMVGHVGAFTGWLIAVMGVARPRTGGQWLAAAWLAAAMAMALLAGGATITHFYYNLAVTAPLAVWIGHGAGRWRTAPLRWATSLLVLAGPLLVLASGQVQQWYEVRPGEVACAAAVRELTEPDASVLTVCYGTQLLYACDRRGFYAITVPLQLSEETLRRAAADGYDYFATGQRELIERSAEQGVREYLAGRRQVAAGPDYLVVDLRHPVVAP